MRTPVFLLLLPACVVGGGERSWSFEEARAVSVELANGSVDVMTHDEDHVRIEWSGGGVGNGGVPDCSLVDGVVKVDANGGLLSGGDFWITVPERLMFSADSRRSQKLTTLSIDELIGSKSCSSILRSQDFGMP